MKTKYIKLNVFHHVIKIHKSYSVFWYLICRNNNFFCYVYFATLFSYRWLFCRVISNIVSEIIFQFLHSLINTIVIHLHCVYLLSSVLSNANKRLMTNYFFWLLVKLLNQTIFGGYKTYMQFDGVLMKFGDKNCVKALL